MAPGFIEMNFIKINSSCSEGVGEMTKRSQTPPFPNSLKARKRSSYRRPSKIQLAQLKGHEKKIWSKNKQF